MLITPATGPNTRQDMIRRLKEMIKLIKGDGCVEIDYNIFETPKVRVGDYVLVDDINIQIDENSDGTDAYTLTKRTFKAYVMAFNVTHFMSHHAIDELVPVDSGNDGEPYLCVELVGDRSYVGRTLHIYNSFLVQRVARIARFGDPHYNINELLTHPQERARKVATQLLEKK